jgi:ankyrin repeat protein
MFWLNSLLWQNGDTALIKSAEGGHTTIVKLLLHGGADKDAKNKVKCSYAWHIIVYTHEK